MKTYRHQHYLFLLYLVFILGGCSATEADKVVDGSLVLLDSINAPSPDHMVDSVIALYRQDLEAEMNQVVVYSEVAMTKSSPEGLLNNFVADLVFEISKELYQPADDQPIDFCLLNYGGLRTSIPQGAVTRSRVFELMPFENQLVVLTLSAESTWELFEYLATSNVGMPVSGITLGISNKKVHEVTIKGEAFDNSRNYKVVTSDYLAQGGDNMNFFLDAMNSEMLAMKVRDAILMHMKEKSQNNQQITSGLDGRIYYTD